MGTVHHAIGTPGTSLLTTICERPATVEELRQRLRQQLDDKKFRQHVWKERFGMSVSDQWLKERISELQHAIQRAGASLLPTDLE